MALWTLMIENLPTVCFQAKDEASAEAIAHGSSELGQALRDDLLVLERSDGRPLCDGQAPIKVRVASSIEHRNWNRIRSEAIREGQLREPLHIWDETDWLAIVIPDLMAEHVTP